MKFELWINGKLVISFSTMQYPVFFHINISKMHSFMFENHVILLPILNIDPPEKFFVQPKAKNKTVASTWSNDT